METYPQVIHRKRSFLSALALGVSSIAVTLIAGAGAIILYGMNIADRKTDSLIGAVEQAVRGLPELRQSLPPALADLLDDRRSPDYHDRVNVKSSLAAAPAPGARGGVRAVIEAQNLGGEVVTLLSTRIVILGEQGDPIASWNEWIATPIAAEDGWRGPLMPGARRRFAARTHTFRSDIDPSTLQVEVEITDIRVWAGDRTGDQAGAKDKETGRDRRAELFFSEL